MLEGFPSCRKKEGSLSRNIDACPIWSQHLPHDHETTDGWRCIEENADNKAHKFLSGIQQISHNPNIKWAYGSKAKPRHGPDALSMSAVSFVKSWEYANY